MDRVNPNIQVMINLRLLTATLNLRRMCPARLRLNAITLLYKVIHLQHIAQLTYTCYLIGMSEYTGYAGFALYSAAPFS